MKNGMWKLMVVSEPGAQKEKVKRPRPCNSFREHAPWPNDFPLRPTSWRCRLLPTTLIMGTKVLAYGRLKDISTIAALDPELRFGRIIPPLQNSNCNRTFHYMHIFTKYCTYNLQKLVTLLSPFFRWPSGSKSDKVDLTGVVGIRIQPVWFQSQLS